MFGEFNFLQLPALNGVEEEAKRYPSRRKKSIDLYYSTCGEACTNGNPVINCSLKMLVISTLRLFRKN